jgi:hypothetical protein
VGEAAVTPGYDLAAKYVIHTVAPVWQGGGKGETALLAACYEKSLKLAQRQGCGSVAFPLMSAGNHGFPKDVALRTAMDAISAFLMKHELEVYLVVFSRDAFRLSEKLHKHVESFIDENYIHEANLSQYGVANKCTVRGQQQAWILEEQMRRRAQAVREEISYPCVAPQAMGEMCPAPKTPAESRKKPLSGWLRRPKLSLGELLEQTDASFSETLLKLIDGTGKKDSQIYTRANVSRQHFSKIRNNPNYKPTKATAIAFAIALELDLEGTQDLIGRAGYALTRSSKFDVIIMYFISSGNYDIMQINAALFEYDQSLLGA